jgi:glycine cleavage system H lipoate-binding protein
MIPHDILTLYSAKMLEYGIAVLFLVLFIPFWRYVQGPAPAAAPARVPQRVPATRAAEWFLTPADRLFHRGHAWLKAEQDGLVTVGLDDFAAKLVGPLARVALPAPGSRVGQGEQGWSLVASDGKAVSMLSPVDGEVAAVNGALASAPELAERDPYGDGWVLKVRPSRLRANRINLMAGRAVQRWMEEAAAGLRGQVAPGLGALAQDGGAPVSGMAKALDPDGWDRLAARFLLTGEEDVHA